MAAVETALHAPQPAKPGATAPAGHGAKYAASATVPPADLVVMVADTLVKDVEAEKEGAQKATKAFVALGAAARSAGVVTVVTAAAPAPVRTKFAAGTVANEEAAPVRLSEGPAHAL